MTPPWRRIIQISCDADEHQIAAFLVRTMLLEETQRSPRHGWQPSQRPRLPAGAPTGGGGGEVYGVRLLGRVSSLGRPRARVDQHAMRPGLICLPRRERAQLDLRREIFFRAKSAPMTPYRWTFGQSFSGVYDSANDPLGDRIREDKISASEERTVRQEAWSTPPPSANWCAIWQEPPIP